MEITRSTFHRRAFLSVTARLGLASTLFPGVLYAMAEEKKKLTAAMIDEAASVAGISIDDSYKEMMLEDLNDALGDYKAVHELKLPNGVSPALVFDPILPGKNVSIPRRPLRPSKPINLQAPKNIEALAFWSVGDLSELLRKKKVSSVALTEMYLHRLKTYDPVLKFVITFLTDRAMAQAIEADHDIAAGRYRGPLHGIPWGAKDLLSVKGYKTTWGAGGFEQQEFDEDATVVQRLDRAGAVLLAKLTLGALAMGDVWFGGTTKNPWKVDQGSSGSSAGSASATAAGCVAFAIGTETLGSIASPSTRCGVTGLRPTFGRVPRTGGMALTWSMDKIGPLCRYVEDCALVMSVINGPDEKDASVKDLPFNWDANLDIKTLRVGYVKEAFEKEPEAKANETEDDKKSRLRRIEQRKIDLASLEILRSQLGLKLIDIKLPEFPFGNLLPILNAEAAAAFDDLTRSGRDKLLTAQGKNDWPNSFRVGHFIPAVEYVNANRARTVGMQKWAEMFATIDVLVAPTFGTSQLVATNLTGHPAVILPNGFREDGTPTSLTFVGNLYREDQLLAVAKAYQDATEWNKRHPVIAAPKPA
jgi:Asp-tRNA(Asn)/Glu-tRNA(Gln) amidotransferase A subunit family amidase